MLARVLSGALSRKLARVLSSIGLYENLSELQQVCYCHKILVDNGAWANADNRVGGWGVGVGDDIVRGIVCTMFCNFFKHRLKIASLRFGQTLIKNRIVKKKV